jgi:hypothetical protein
MNVSPEYRSIAPSAAINSKTIAPSICKTISGKSCTPFITIDQTKTLSPTMQSIQIITINSNGTIVSVEGHQTSDEFMIYGFSNVTIRGNGGGDQFTVFPRKHVVINITDFNVTTDVINLQAFPLIHQLSDLNITTSSSVLPLSSLKPSSAEKDTSKMINAEKYSTLNTHSIPTYTVIKITQYHQSIILFNVKDEQQLTNRCFLFRSIDPHPNENNGTTSSANQHSLMIIMGALLFLFLIGVTIVYYRKSKKISFHFRVYTSQLGLHDPLFLSKHQKARLKAPIDFQDDLLHYSHQHVHHKHHPVPVIASLRSNSQIQIQKQNFHQRFPSATLSTTYIIRNDDLDNSSWTLSDRDRSSQSHETDESDNIDDDGKYQFEESDLTEQVPHKKVLNNPRNETEFRLDIESSGEFSSVSNALSVQSSRSTFSHLSKSSSTSIGSISSTSLNNGFVSAVDHHRHYHRSEKKEIDQSSSFPVSDQRISPQHSSKKPITSAVDVVQDINRSFDFLHSEILSEVIWIAPHGYSRGYAVNIYR